MTNYLEQCIQEHFSKIQKISPDEIDWDANLFEFYNLNSLRAVKLLSTIEVEFDIEFPNDELKKIKTLNHVKKLSEALIQKQDLDFAYN